MTHRRYGTLDGLRGVAAFVVLIGHLSGPFQKIVPHGYLAVDLFFLMSGFVVAAAYEKKLLSDWSILRFMRVRLARLWPLYALSFIVGLVCYAIARAVKPADDFLFPLLPLGSVVAMGLLFVPQFARYGGGAVFPLDPAAWSLSVEFFGNIVYGLVARSLGNATLKLVVAIGAVGIAMTAFRTGDLNVGVGVNDAVYGYLRFAFSFPLGVLLYRLHIAGRLPHINVPPLAILVTVALLLSGLAPLVPLYDVLIVVALFPLILIAALDREPPARWIAPFALAGAVSYPLYLLHEPVTGLILTIMPHGPLHVALLLCVPPFFVLGAYLADRYFDRPAQKWLKAQFEPAPVVLAS